MGDLLPNVYTRTRRECDVTMTLGGRLELIRLSNVELAKRNLLVRPPEPPMEVIFGDPTNSIYIGRTAILNVPFYWDYQNVANPHIAIVGISGSGKSYFIKTFLLRAAYVWNSNGLIIDWAGEYKDWVKQTGGKVVSLGKGSYLNIMDLGGMKPYDRIKQIMRTLEILTDITQYPEQRRLTEQALEKAYIEAKFRMDVRNQKNEFGKSLQPPTFKDVVRILEEMAQMGNYEFPAELDNSIYRIKKFTKSGEDYFAQTSTVSLDEIITSEKGIRLLVVLDEAWKISKEENSDAVMIVREGRKYNFGMIIASQNPTDISDTIFSNVGTTFMLKVKFERFLDYLQGSLNFSNFMRDEISKLGVGQCAVNMSFTNPTPYPNTFLIKQIEGEEPSKEYFLDLASVLSTKQKRDISMARSISFLKDDFRRKLRQYGLEDDKIESVSKLFEQHNRHFDVVSFVLLLERYGISRRTISDFLKDVGIDDITIINIFGKADVKKTDNVSEDFTQVVVED